MSRDPRYAHWQTIAHQLPFGLDDSRAVNRCFLRWRRRRAYRDKRAIDLWTYCFINRYFGIKTRDTDIRSPVELDQMIEHAFLKVERNMNKVDAPKRFSHWVSVVCKHTFINHVRQEITPVSLEEDYRPPPAGRINDGDTRYDAEVTYGTLSQAITRLPPFLRQTARLRFLRRLSYQRISDITGKSVTTLRTYVHKTTTRFQNDPALTTLREELLGG